MNPFDLKSVLLAKHAQHVALVHFPIALIFVSVAFDLLSLRKQNLALLRAAYYTVIAAAIAAVPTVATGILAWQLQCQGKASRGNLKLHMFLALSASVLIWLICWLHIREQRKPQSADFERVIPMLLFIEQNLENGDDPGRELWKQSLALLSAAYHTVNVTAISAVTTIVTGILPWDVQRETASHIKHAFFVALQPLQDYYKPATSS
jgi:uncharacterized membrane protein